MSELSALLDLSGRVAFITGAASGIGKAIALELASAGAQVVIADIDETLGRSTAAEIEGRGGRAMAIALDVSNDEGVTAAVERIISEVGGIDILVNNAGLGARVATVDVTTEAWRSALAVGLDGSFFCVRAAGRLMIARRRGAVVNIASIMGLSGGGFYPNLAYHAAKGALVSLTRALAMEWAPYGIRVNAVAPTFARTKLTQKLLADNKMEEMLLAATPLRRFVEPHEVAYAVHFLVSDAAAMITGHTLPVDGGWTAR